MMRLLAFSILFAGLAASAQAERLLADAFGVYDAAAVPDRAAWSGLVSVIGEPGQSDGEHILGAPGAAETVLIHFGEKSMEQGSAEALIAAILVDANGNLVADGTLVSLRAADGAIEAPSVNGIAARRVPAGDNLGQHHAWAETVTPDARRQSPRVTYRVVPALREQAAGLVPPGAPFRTEDGASFEAQLVTPTDRPDLLDGIAAQIVLTHPEGDHTVVPGMWIGGQLHARLLTRDMSGPAEASLHMPYAASPQVSVAIQAIVSSGPLQVRAVRIPDLAATRLELGPLTTSAGHLLHDGSLVEVSVTDGEGRTFDRQVWTLDGLAEVTVPSAALPLELSVMTPGGELTGTVAEAEDDR